MYYAYPIRWRILPSEKGNLLVLDHGGDADRIEAEIASGRAAQFRAEYDFMPEGGSPEQLHNRFKWLHRVPGQSRGQCTAPPRGSIFTRLSVAGNHAAGDARTGVAGGLACVVVRIRVHDDGATEGVGVAAGTELDALDHRIHGGDTIGVSLLVGDVAGMMRTLARIAVGLLRRIEVSARAGGIGRTAIAVLVNVEPVRAVGLEPADAAGDVDTVVGADEGKPALHMAVAGRCKRGVGADRGSRGDGGRRTGGGRRRNTRGGGRSGSLVAVDGASGKHDGGCNGRKENKTCHGIFRLDRGISG